MPSIRSNPVIRAATVGDLGSVHRVVAAAYGVYLPRMDKPPAPMLDDYALRIRKGEAHVGTADGRVVGVLVLIDQSDHLLLDNVAVDPAAQGDGIGRRLVGFAEREAARRGYREIRLYTHVAMAANVAYYQRLGWSETHRATVDGYQRIFMRKEIVLGTAVPEKQA
jgi:ribosomal protein S18 acetylase RimI-like enzyme